MTVRSFGDSHSMFTFAGLPVTPHHVGPWTMHRIARDGMHDSPAFKDGDSLIFCFGEIDVRCHVKKQAVDQGCDPQVVIDKLSEDYMASLVKFGQSRPELELFVLSVVPPARAFPQENFPFIGSDQERASFTKSLNARLRQLCSSAGIGYIDVHTTYADDQGMLPISLADGCTIHIGNTRFVGPALVAAGVNTN